MSNMIPQWAVPDWTATRNDIQWPWTHLLGVLVASMAAYVGYTLPFLAADSTAPSITAFVALIVFFGVVPLLALREQTEVLYDGMHLAMRVVVLGFALFFIAFWTTEGAADGVSAFASGPLMAAFTVTITGIYGALILGVMWIIQFARKGTSGVETEPQ